MSPWLERGGTGRTNNIPVSSPRSSHGQPRFRPARRGGACSCQQDPRLLRRTGGGCTLTIESVSSSKIRGNAPADCNNLYDFYYYTAVAPPCRVREWTLRSGALFWGKRPAQGKILTWWATDSKVARTTGCAIPGSGLAQPLICVPSEGRNGSTPSPCYQNGGSGPRYVLAGEPSGLLRHFKRPRRRARARRIATSATPALTSAVPMSRAHRRSPDGNLDLNEQLQNALTLSRPRPPCFWIATG
jgi:hypothetical protein